MLTYLNTNAMLLNVSNLTRIHKTKRSGSNLPHLIIIINSCAIDIALKIWKPLAKERMSGVQSGPRNKTTSKITNFCNWNVLKRRSTSSCSIWSLPVTGSPRHKRSKSWCLFYSLMCSLTNFTSLLIKLNCNSTTLIKLSFLNLLMDLRTILGTSRVYWVSNGRFLILDSQFLLAVATC